MESWTSQLKRLGVNVLGPPTPDEVKRMERAKAQIAAMDAAERAEHPFMLKAGWTTLSREECKHKTFDTFVPRTPELAEVKRKVMGWRRNESFGMLLYGPPGTGKTHLLKALLVREAADDYRCGFDTVTGVMDKIKGTFDSNERARQGVFDELVAPKILVLDDFGAEKSTEWAQEQFLQVLEKRMRLDRVVFMSSNLVKDELTAKYQARILDRMMECMVFVKVTGPSFRREIYQENLAKTEK